jgi:hypothetical protein
MRVFSALLLILALLALVSPAFAAQRPAAPAKTPDKAAERIFLESEVVFDPVEHAAYDQDGIPINGTIQGFYPSGRLSWATQWVEGKLHGVTRNYYENRNLKEETTWVNGKLHGPARWYDEQGKLRREIVYENDKDPSAPAEAQEENTPEDRDNTPEDKRQ